MSKGRDRTVSKRDDGQWANKRNDAKKATSLHGTQKEAENAARKNLKNQGGGELTTKGRDGTGRSGARTPSPRAMTPTRRRILSTDRQASAPRGGSLVARSDNPLPPALIGGAFAFACVLRPWINQRA